MAKKTQPAKESPEVVADRLRRMKWWTDARFGMFVHFGLYSQLGRHEWVMNRERIPVKEYEKLARTFNPKPGSPREWARLAKKAGMKYMVMTTKHHEGFCLWDSKQTHYNAVKMGPHRDIVAEYVAACREFGLKCGFYYSLMDWHHPDGHRCVKDEKARRRFCDYTYGLVQELMGNYGKIDILWYDVSWPLPSPEKWESAKLNAMARRLQPDILINDRSQLPEDFGTPEEHISAAQAGRSWEACMTFNGAWGWRPTPPEDWHSARKVVTMLRQVTGGRGNLLLNIGPKPDGSVPPEAIERLAAVGKWTAKYGDVIYGQVDRPEGLEGWSGCGTWTRKGKDCFFWVFNWPGETLAIGGLRTKVKSVQLLPDGKPLRFTQESRRLLI
ncbi:MAG: alpha-L-fucosidase, partial [Planctomycetota bacterium]|nr:alpha-L-fucosidase [Planctomycetota bacterium]